MNRHQYKYFLFTVIITVFSACTSMHDPYDEFIEDGSIIYPGTPDSVLVYPGKNRIQLSFPLPSDPTVSKARIYWHNGEDSVETSFDQTEGTEMIDIMLNDMQEGSYTFDIYTYDEEGNSSINVSAVGEVYGETYINSLLSRLVTEALFANDSLTIRWGNAGENVIGTEINYPVTSGASQHLLIPVEEDCTIITDYAFNTTNELEYRTLYQPDSMAIDTFYSAYETIRVLGPPAELDKGEWAATASSYDERHGDDRAPGSAIDNDASTIWVNSIDPQTTYPHSITIDVGRVEEEIDGLSFIVQDRSETPQAIEISISDDNATWISIGTFNLENTATTQYIDFIDRQDFRYVKIITKEPHGNTNNVVIGEIGIYRR